MKGNAPHHKDRYSSDFRVRACVYAIEDHLTPEPETVAYIECETNFLSLILASLNRGVKENGK